MGQLLGRRGCLRHEAVQEFLALAWSGDHHWTWNRYRFLLILVKNLLLAAPWRCVVVRFSKKASEALLRVVSSKKLGFNFRQVHLRGCCRGLGGIKRLLKHRFYVRFYFEDGLKSAFLKFIRNGALVHVFRWQVTQLLVDNLHQVSFEIFRGYLFQRIFLREILVEGLLLFLIFVCLTELMQVWFRLRL